MRNYIKRTKGVPIDWDELKTHRTLTITETAWKKLDEMGKEYGISRSELIERFARGVLEESSPTAV